MNGTSILEATSLPQRSSNDQFDGIEQRRFKATTQSIGGKTELAAFNIGNLNTAGVYADSISSDVPDYFKFNFAFRSTLVLSASDLTGQPLNSIGLQVYKAGANGASSTLVSDYATQILEPGDYYIKVSSNLDNINYRLNVEGKPQVTELVGNTFTGPSQVLLTAGASDTDNPATTISINYSVKNAGTLAAPNVKVSFYLSRDQTFSLAGAVPDFKVAVDQVFDLSPNQSNASTPLTLTLPAWKDNFWTVDGTYYLLEVIDPDNTIAETNETNNVSVLALDVQQIPTINLRGKSLSVNGTSFAPTAVVSTTFVTENNGFKSANTPFEISFLLAKTPVFSKGDSNAWSLATASIDGGIAGKKDSGPQAINLTLPPRDWSGWASLSGQQTFYIGMIQNTNSAVNDVNPDDNQNRGQNIDWVAINVTL